MRRCSRRTSVACPSAACHNLAELPGVSGAFPDPPLWHGYLFATMRDKPRHSSLRAPVLGDGARLVSAPSGPLPQDPGSRTGNRCTGWPQYSIRAIGVQHRAADVAGRRATHSGDIHTIFITGTDAFGHLSRPCARWKGTPTKGRGWMTRAKPERKPPTSASTSA
ncbi:hypothetical protein SCATT_46170 [Streptantibioticus cattleyicolor NRRL 8057 = DSM 46488]|uniref:Uncharacterized protein n=1 Tax=Streptantibioticus cattleyicolor (strain ATCC 35852 / DSM 46488 / JCM 4925 / NBRC 14057 / NRRL 8057) TaxID=1003195 RepID=G8X3D7_STREN|nr:hypothetical protein SCATT_46170 [Streptantibioticus cattleyicolor NRRL 8057 = DSM 46488]